MSSSVIHIAAPYVTLSKYAEMIGVSLHSVRSKVKEGHLPTIKQGKHRLVNVALLTKQALEAEL